jgi:hypothetical protein
MAARRTGPKRSFTKGVGFHAASTADPASEELKTRTKEITQLAFKGYPVPDFFTEFLSTLRPDGYPARRKTRSQRGGGSPPRRWDFLPTRRWPGHPLGSADLARRTQRITPAPNVSGGEMQAHDSAHTLLSTSRITPR